MHIVASRNDVLKNAEKNKLVPSSNDVLKKNAENSKLIMCQPLSLDFINTISFHPCEMLQSKPCYYPYLTSEEVMTQRGEQVLST